jgi:membrane-associated protein
MWHASTLASGGTFSQGLLSFSDWLERLSGNPWFYLIIFAIALLDAIVPVVPSETAVILGGIAAGRKDLWLPLVIVFAAAGAFTGDNIGYELGARAGRRIVGWAQRKPQRAKRLDWAKTQLASRGGSLLMTARFIPGGRTIITIASGLTGQPRPRFRLFVALAATIWATYAAVLGYVFGNRFKDNHTKALLLAFGCAIGVTVLIEVVRKVRHRKQPSH